MCGAVPVCDIDMEARSKQLIATYSPDLVNLSISDVYSSHPLLHRGRLMSAHVLPCQGQWYGTGDGFLRSQLF